MRHPIAALLCAGALIAAPAASAHAAPCANADVTPSAANVPAVRTAILCLLNDQRAAHGLGTVQINGSLAHAATGYSRAMVREQFFNHISPGGSTLVSRVKVTTYLHAARTWALGENIAWGTGERSTPGEIVEHWMHSPGHRANILDGHYRDIGIGVALGAPVAIPAADGAAATYTTDFGMRRP